MYEVVRIETAFFVACIIHSVWTRARFCVYVCECVCVAGTTLRTKLTEKGVWPCARFQRWLCFFAAAGACLLSAVDACWVGSRRGRVAPTLEKADDVERRTDDAPTKRFLACIRTSEIGRIIILFRDNR